MRQVASHGWRRSLAVVVLSALPLTAAQAGPVQTYSRPESAIQPGESRIGIGVEPRIGVGVVPRTGIGADTGLGLETVPEEPPSGVLSPSAGDSPATIRAAQDALTGQGLAPDRNGIVGPRTRQAIRTFQRNHNLPVTGTLDNETRQRLGLP